GVDDIISPGASPRHSSVNIRRHGDQMIWCYDECIRAAEIGKQEVRVVLDVVVGAKHDRIQVLIDHDLAQPGQASLHFACRERVLLLGTILNVLQTLKVGDVHKSTPQMRYLLTNLTGWRQPVSLHVSTGVRRSLRWTTWQQESPRRRQSNTRPGQGCFP